MVIEACVESIQEAVNAETNGANRIELCSRLDLDGLTPSESLVREVVDTLKIPVMVMIRPREGNFIYSSFEFDQMLRSIGMCKKYPVLGVVFGALTLQNQPDLELLKIFADVASPLEITFHKAIDNTPDPVKSAELIITVKQVTRILTSGGQPTALQGKEMIKKMQKAVSEKISIIAAGKITEENLNEHINLLEVNEYHGRKIAGFVTHANLR